MGVALGRGGALVAAILGLGALVSALDAGCTIYDTSLLVSGDVVPPGAGIGFWSSNDGHGGKCFTAGVPTPSERPPASDAPALPPIYLAIHDVQLGALDKDGKPNANAWKDRGFDLDNTCTGSPTCDTAGEPVALSCKPPTSSVAYDGNYCRDNTFGRLEYTVSLVPEISKRYGLNDEAFNCALCVGDRNILIRLTDYNGTDNDDRVRVDLYPSPGLEKVLPWNCADESWRNEPCFTPDMKWTIWDRFLTSQHGGPDLSNSKAADDAAYVRDGYLVAQLAPDTRLWFPGKNALTTAYPLYLHSSVVTAKLGHAADQTWIATDGIIGGRVRSDDLLLGFRQIGLCENDQSYALLPQFIAQNLDISAASVNDPNLPCDAMSIGVAFTATQAVAGKVISADDLVECPYGRTPEGGAPEGGTADGGDGGSDAGIKDAGIKDATAG